MGGHAMFPEPDFYPGLGSSKGPHTPQPWARTRGPWAIGSGPTPRLKVLGRAWVSSVTRGQGWVFLGRCVWSEASGAVV